MNRVRRWLAGRRTTRNSPSPTPITTSSISVTEADIEAGRRGDSSRSPVSLAIIRSLAVAQARVGTSHVTLVRGWEPLDVQLAALPPEACAFLQTYEAGEPARPFTFELSVEAALHPAGELPPDLRAAVTRIERRAAALLVRATEFSPGSKDLYLVEQVRERYLPDAVGEYQALPGELRSGPISPDGRSGAQVLRHELQLMEERLIGIARELDQPGGET